MGTFYRVKEKEWDYRYIKMVIFIRGTGKKIKKMGMEFTIVKILTKPLLVNLNVALFQKYLNFMKETNYTNYKGTFNKYFKIGKEITTEYKFYYQNSFILKKLFLIIIM